MDDQLRLDRHFAPMHQTCDPCAHVFQYIGKIETFRNDVEFLFEKWGRDFDDFNIKFSDFVAETATDTSTGHINFLFSAKHILHEIKYPFKHLMLRTWRDLQSEVISLNTYLSHIQTMNM